MRALFVFGFIALYIACAFVSPSQANLRSFAKQAQQIHALNASALVSQIGHVANLADDTSVSVLVDTARNAMQNVNTENAVRLAASLTPDSQTVLSVVHSSLSDLVDATQNSALRSQFERIQWAVGKHDPRLCKALAENNLDATDTGTPTFGDLLAFCLATTMQEPSRCEQINPASAPSLFAACQKELDFRS